MNTVKPILVLAIGNPSRGDDAIGPILAERLEALGLPDVEVITDFQLAPEHALDLAGREKVIFVDAGEGTPAPYELRRVEARDDFSYTSHAMSPEAVLSTYARVTGSTPPEAWVLCVRGEAFGLGEPLSAVASCHADAALGALALGASQPTRGSTDRHRRDRAPLVR